MNLFLGDSETKILCGLLLQSNFTDSINNIISYYSKQLGDRKSFIICLRSSYHVPISTTFCGILRCHSHFFYLSAAQNMLPIECFLIFFFILCSCVLCYTLLVMKAFFFKCRPNLLLQLIGLWNVSAFCVEWLFFHCKTIFKPQQFTRKGFCFSGSFPKSQILTEKAKSFSTCWLTPTGDFKPCRTDKSDRF